MLFKSKIYNEIIKWKESLNKKRSALLIKGLKHVGKTTLIKKFAKNFYDECIYFDLSENSSYKKLFEGDINVSNLLLTLKINFPNNKFIEGKTVFVFDEVNECPKARYLIEQLIENTSFDLILSESSLCIKDYDSFKSRLYLGYITTLYLYPLDFEEFLWSLNISIEVIEVIKDSFTNLKEVDPFLNNFFLDCFKKYILIGGMPEVVNSFIQNKDYIKCYKAIKNILIDYKNDFGKYLDEDLNIKLDKRLFINILDIYKSLPNQLIKDNKKFSYSLVGKNTSSRKYLDSIKWLEEYGLIKCCYNLKTFKEPLEDNNIRKDSFKVFILDIGLFIAMLGKDTYKNVIIDNLDIYKGTIYESVIGETLIKNNIDLYYFSKPNGLEIDFIIRYKNDICALEVKSNDARKSFKKYLN